MSGEGKEEPKEPEAPRSHATNTSLQVYHDKMIGSGAEGAVFFGRLGKRDVAVKRTRSGTTAHEAKIAVLATNPKTRPTTPWAAATIKRHRFQPGA